MMDAYDLNHCKALSRKLYVLGSIVDDEEGRRDGSGGQFDTQTIMDSRR